MNTNDNNINDFAESNYGRLKSQEADFSKGIALYMEDVSVWFDKFRALNNLSLYIKEGELRCIIGPNGAGKTTLMRLMAGLDQPSAGRVLWQNRDVTGQRVQDRGVAMVYQQFINYPSLTVYENIASPLRVQGKPKAEIEDRKSVV